MIKFSHWLNTWFKERASHIELGPNDNYFEVGAIDSFGVIELIEDLEQTFAIRFSQEDLQDRRFPFIAGLTEILVEKEQ